MENNNGETADTLIKNADIAMYRTKKRGVDCYELFSDKFNDGNGSGNSQTHDGQLNEEVNK